MKINYTKLIVLFAAFLDILWIWIIIPSLPWLQTYFGVNEFLMSLSVTSYAVASFLSWPILGQLWDRYGRKPIFMICILWSVLSWFTIALSKTYRIFILWRVINWITGWNISIIESILSDISKDSKERKANLWLFGAIFGSAFIVWPFIWAIMIHAFGDMWPFWLAWILSLVELVLIQFKMKESNNEKHSRKINRNPLWIIMKWFKNTKINKYFFSYAFLLLWLTMFQAILSLYLNSMYGMSWIMTWYILSWIWAIQIVNQTFLMKKFWLKYFGEKNMIMLINIVILILYLILIFVTSFNIFIILIFAVMLIGSLANPMYQWEALEHADKQIKWEIFGIFSAIMALNMWIWAMFWGYLLENKINIFIFSAFFVFISLLIVINMFNTYYKKQEIA